MTAEEIDKMSRSELFAFLKAKKIAVSQPIRTTRSEAIAFVVMASGFIVAPAFVYPVFLMKALCFALFACAFNLLIGYVGLLSFGHALFFGWASYVSAYTAKVWGLPPELAILAGTAAGAGLGLIAGLLAIRRQGIYFAMITLALAQMMYFFAVQAPFTGGEDGIQAVPRGRAFGILDLSQQMNMYFFVLALYLASLFAYGLVVQRGFVDAAQQEREYWSRIVALVPDLSGDTVVILVGSEPSRNRFILPSSWSDSWVFRFLYHDARGRSPFLVGGRFPLHRGGPNEGFDESLVQARDGKLRWSAEVPGWMRVDRAQPLESGRVVVLERRGFKWKRRGGSITLQGIDIDLPPAPPGATIRLLPGPLHDLLLAPAEGSARATR